MTPSSPKVAIVGFGAAGMMAAVIAARNGCEVTVFEKNEKAGKKLYITGKGRCNVTNNCDEREFLNNVAANPKFLRGALNRFGPAALMEFLTGLGVPLKTERGNRVFPESDKSSDIIRAFTKECERLKVKVRYGVAVTGIEIRRHLRQIITQTCVPATLGPVENTSCVIICHSADGAVETFDKVILACGGISYPLTGSTGEGFKIAAELGHKIMPLRPALVPIILKEDVSRLEGLSLKNTGFAVFKGGKKIYSDFGELLFTDKGVSGPVVLSASSLINKTDLSDIYISLDLKPALDEKQLDNRVLRDFKDAGNKQFKNSLNALLPQSLIPVIVELSGIEPLKEINAVTREERIGLVRLLKDLRFNVKRLGAVEEGIVTSGGVCVDEINPRTMESKLAPGVYFAGEMLDVDALTGGFNLQIAWTTGYVAGIACGNSRNDVFAVAKNDDMMV